MDPSTNPGFDFEPDLPVHISWVGSRYLIFDVNVATYLRRHYHICGTAVGTLPLAPSQNLFLGVPVELMPEDAQVLVENGVGLIVDDARIHDQAMRTSDISRRQAYLARIDHQSRLSEQARSQEKLNSRKRALVQKVKNKSVGGSQSPPSQPSLPVLDDQSQVQGRECHDETLFEHDAQPSASPGQELRGTSVSTRHQITPATSQLLLPPPAQGVPAPMVDNLPSSYPLYRHLHNSGYFMTPGLRFGCQYTVYPGDPLRFHSHFLAFGSQWDEEIDLVDIVSGGRLGTGVKKGFLMGGEDPTGRSRTFSVEWAAM